MSIERVLVGALTIGDIAASAASASGVSVCRAMRKVSRRRTSWRFSPGSARRNSSTLALPRAWISGFVQAMAALVWPHRLLIWRERSWLRCTRLWVESCVLA